MFLKYQSFCHKSYITETLNDFIFSVTLFDHPRNYRSTGCLKTITFSGSSISFEDFCIQEPGKYKAF